MAAKHQRGRRRTVWRNVDVARNFSGSTTPKMEMMQREAPRRLKTKAVRMRDCVGGDEG